MAITKSGISKRELYLLTGCTKKLWLSRSVRERLNHEGTKETKDREYKRA